MKLFVSDLNERQLYGEQFESRFASIRPIAAFLAGYPIRLRIAARVVCQEKVVLLLQPAGSCR